ncbi:MAG: SH3 domain-containing protein [Myxococcota bacterium]
MPRLLLVVLLVGGLSGVARADDVEVYARVTVDATPLRAGPGQSYRSLGLARRGDTFRVRRRGTRGYWFQIERADGTLAWIYGETAYTHELGEGDGRRPNRVFAPPPLLGSRVEIAALFGVLGDGGIMSLRVTALVAPELGLEASGAVNVSPGGRLGVLGAGAIINLFPEWPVVPFLAVGGGVSFVEPNADTFLLEGGSTPHLYGGGGLRFGFKGRFTLRLDVRSYVFFEADRYVTEEEYTGGVSVFF